MYELRLEKSSLREKFRKIRNSIPPETKKEYDTQICNKLMSMNAFLNCECILLYSPLEGEVDVSSIIQTGLNQNKKIAFPKCDDKTMSYYFANSLDELSPGFNNILEPSDQNEMWTQEKYPKALCIIPAFTFDKYGYRIGYGGGYYDRFLSSFEGTKVGLLYRMLLSDRVPRGKFDNKVDILITEKGLVKLHD